MQESGFAPQTVAEVRPKRFVGPHDAEVLLLSKR